MKMLCVFQKFLIFILKRLPYKYNIFTKKNKKFLLTFFKFFLSFKKNVKAFFNDTHRMPFFLSRKA